MVTGQALSAQNPLGRFGNFGAGGGGGSGKDSLEHRKEDTITINFRYLDSSRLQHLDSSIYDLGRKIPRPATWINMGNMGAAARNLVFTPRMLSGWDPGWHAYDLYMFTAEETKFYNTTKPYTELGYMLASKSEQDIDIVHTQNYKPNWNFGLEYRLTNAPGTFINQNSNHNNYRFSSWYQSKNKRYQNFFVLVASKLSASENGGIEDPKDLDSAKYSSQATIPVQLGPNRAASGNPFTSTVTTGTKYSTSTYLMRQQYDLGQKDSIVTDSSVIPLFYPRVRIENTEAYTTYNYQFIDAYAPQDVYSLDTAYYRQNLGISRLQPTDSVTRLDNWHVLSSDMSIYQFPDAKNPQQFFKLGATLEVLSGRFDTSTMTVLTTAHKVHDQNVFAHAEYRNKTRNQKWDIEAFGKLYLNGLDVGDYNASIALRRLISRNLGYFQAGFENTNRTPGFIFDKASSFNLDTAAQRRGFLKENTTHVFASIDQPKRQLSLSASLYLLSNYSYVADYYKEAQASSLFNLLQVSLRKQFTIYRHWHWRTFTILQQVTGSSPVHVPLLVSSNQVGYDGNLGFKYLNLSFGTEIRYVSPYKADGYSPVTGQFFTQKATNKTITQTLPDINLYVHFRIRGFTAYVQGENLNAMAFQPAGFGFYHNNFVAPYYPEPGFIFRLGIFWGFIN